MNLEYTSYVMSTSYLIENMLIKSKKNHKDTLQDINKKIHSITVKNRNDKNNELPKPDNLEFVDAEHDFQSGMTGVLFRDKTTKQLIMGFTGTNLENDFYNDAIKTDIGSILFGDGLHYQSAYDFYIRMIQKYGKPSVLTGHSLGGNYAHRVALHFNVPKAVVYNSAPLYVNLDKVEKVLTILLDAMTKGVALATAPSLNPLINVTNSFIQLLASLPSVTIAALIARTKIAKLIQPGIIKKINEDLKGFTGQIVRIRSKFDPLNAVSEAFDGFYVGKEYVFDDGLGHDQQGFLSEEIQDLVKTILAPNTRHHYPENQHSLTLEFVAKTLKDVIAPKRPNVNAHVPSIDGISKVGTDKNDSIIGTEKSESINGKAGNDTINGMGGNDVLLGGEGNDTIYGGDGQDWLYGWNGDDYLHGEWGDDTLIGGPGNDTLIGGMGNDEYVFQLGSGHDSIFDGDGTSFLNFRDGINLSNLRAFYTKDKQVALGYKNDSSSFVILKGIRDGERYQDVWIDTQDGSIHGSDKRSPLRDLEGTDGDDEMSPIYAGTRLSGLGGNDILQGSDENDILDGGFGKDTLSGGKGDDTYVFGLGYDTDVISDNQGLNRIKLLDGVSASDMYVSPKGNSVYLVIAKSGDKLYLQNFTYSEKYQKYLLEYANGQQMKLDDPNSPFRRAIGTNDSEWVSAVLDIDTTVLGLAGDDQLYGKGGNDKLFGGEGNDEIYGQAGDDYLYGETGNDKMEGGTGNDFLDGGEGDDRLNGEDDDDILYGAAGNDAISGGSGNDFLYGGLGNDGLYGNAGYDILDGEEGDDYLEGGQGDDTYIFGRGYGHDTIEDYQGVHTIKFLEGITPDDLYTQFGDDSNLNDAGHIVLRVKDSDDQLTIKNFRNVFSWWDGSTSMHESHRNVQLVFADGTTMSIRDKESPIWRMKSGNGDNRLYNPFEEEDYASHEMFLEGNNGNDTLIGAEKNDRLYGGSGNDELRGHGGNDLLDGGVGDDILKGGEGDDTYIFGSGYGHDTIEEVSGLSTIRFKDDIKPNDIYTVYGNKGDITLRFHSNADDAITLKGFSNYFSWWDGSTTINDSRRKVQLLFSDGSTMPIGDKASPVWRISGTDGNDSIRPLFSEDDKIVHELIVQGLDGNDSISGDDMDDRLYGGSGDDKLFGNGGDDLLDGGAGNDELNGDSGNDTLDGGLGNDRLEGGYGDDTYIFGVGYGKETIYDYGGQNKIKFLEGIRPSDLTVYASGQYDIVIKVKDGEDQITISSFRNHNDYRNFSLEFADGTILDKTSALNPLKVIQGTSSNDSISAYYTDMTIKGEAGDDNLYGSSGADTLYGGTGNDSLNGDNGNDFLDGGAGDDRLTGDYGNDILDGGLGNDRLEGGYGDDTYIFGVGYGKETIYDYGGQNKIKFLEGIRPSDLTVYASGQYDIVIKVKDGEDQITISSFRNHNDYRNFSLEFADGTILDKTSALNPLKVIQGTSSNDSISAYYTDMTIKGEAGDDNLYGSSGADTLYGGTGNDSLNGDNGNDFLDGGAGDDRLTGDYGNDILDGGLGNDRLEGGYGDDTYIFGVGYGKETIYDYGGQNKIKFLEGIRPSDLTVYASGQYDIVIKVKDGEDQITISSFRNHNDYRNFSLEFADGTILDKTSALNPLKVIQGTSSNDSISAYYTDMTIKGEAGDDNLYGSSGADTLYGGTGNDSLNGDNGNDFLDGGAGDDRLTGDYGNDILDGGLGNDRLEGGYGDDTYIFGVGYGKETIYDYGGQNKIKFLEGIRPSDLTVYASGQYDIVIKVKDGEDQITISSFRNHNDYRNFSLEFADGTILDKTSALNPLKVIQGTSSNDSISAYYTDMTIKGEAGDDNLYGSSGADTLYGGTGNDSLNGDNGNDFLDGDVGNDELNGGAGNDLLDGGTGNDQLKGGNGNDTYLFGLGSGKDTITDEYGTNKIKFINGIRPTDLEVYTSGQYDIVIKNKSTDDQLTIAYFRYGSSDRNFSLEFDDGTVLARDASSSPFKEIHGTSGNDSIYAYFTDMTIRGGDGNDALHGSSGADRLYGDAGNDELNGGDGNDLLDGGSGNDQLKGGNGNDTYLFGLGSGNDTITDEYGTNKIKFINGIRPSDLEVYTSGQYDIVIKNKSTDDQLTIAYFRYGSSDRNFSLEFDDGTVLARDASSSPFKEIHGTSGNDSISAYFTDMTIRGGDGNDALHGSSGADRLYGDAGNDELNGGDGNDLLDGGTGNDQLKGGNGNDTYLFGLGSGNDTITDEYGTNKIKFINGIRPSDLEVYTSGQYDIVIKNKSTDDQLTIAYFRYGSSDRNFSLEFDDGTVLARDASSSPFKEIHGTSGNDSIYAYFTDMTIRGGDGNDALHGSSGADRLYGDAGNDELNGGDGNDLLDGGTGNDQLKGGNGDDTYIFGLGYGQDTISDSEGLSTIRFGEGISPENLKLAKSDNWNLSLTQGDDQLILNNYFYSSSYRNVRLEFSDKRTATVNDQLMTLDVKAAPVSESAVTPVVQAQTLVTLVNDVASSNPVTNTSPLPQASTTEIRSVTQSQLLVQEVSALPSENTVSAVNSAANTNTNLFTEQLTVQ